MGTLRTFEIKEDQPGPWMFPIMHCVNYHMLHYTKLPPVLFSHEHEVDITVRKERIKDNLLVTDMDTKWKFTEKRPDVCVLLKEYEDNFVPLKLSETIEETVTVIEEPAVKDTYNMNVLSSDEDNDDLDRKPEAKAKTSKSGSDPEHKDDDSSTNTYLGEGNHEEKPEGKLEIASTATLPAKGGWKGLDIND